jgi:plastocyanin
MKPHALVLLPLLLAAFAGCAGSGAQTTHLIVYFSGQAADLHVDVASHLDERPSKGEYDKANLTHPDFYNAHDQLAEWAKATHSTYEAQSFNGSFGSGFFLTAIAGVAADGASAYWSLALNGVDAAVGMSDLQVHAGDTVTWSYTKVEQAPGGSNSSKGLTLAVDPLAATPADTARLSGTVSTPAQLSLKATRNGTVWFSRSLAATGPWSVDVSGLPYGESQLTVVADDGHDSAKRLMPLVRLAPFKFEVQYGHYPGLTDGTTDVLMDIDAFLSAPAYDGKSAPHPTFANVHDLDVAWANQTGSTIEIAWSESLQGYSMSKINGAGSPLDSSSPPYWSLDVNGKTAGFGMTLMPVAPGDQVSWCLNVCVHQP